VHRAFLIIGIPAFVASFCWFAFGWGLRVAILVTAAELAVVAALAIYLLRRANSTESRSGS
jgi:membrane protein implicated in regulation of membrane protease activity